MHEIGAEENILNDDLAFSKSLLGKECAACHRAYFYHYFDKDSSKRDGRKDICPKCLRSPRLSMSEHLSRYQEMNDNSEAQKAQARPDELDYIERNPIGRWMYHNRFIEKLRSILKAKLVVGDAAFLNEFSLYVEDPKCIDSNQVQYIGYIPAGPIQEFSSYKYNERGIPIDESARGYRGILMKLIIGGYITEDQCTKAFGPCDEKVWCRNLHAWRNKEQNG